MSINSRQLLGVLFLKSEGISEGELLHLLSFNETELLASVEEVTNFLNESGLELIMSNKMYQLVAESKDLPETIQNELGKESLSNVALEVLSIVAYHQPITQAGVESMRGVGSEQTLKTLQEKDLVKPISRKVDGVNLPHFVTSNTFLAYLGIRSLIELPEIKRTDNE